MAGYLKEPVVLQWDDYSIGMAITYETVIKGMLYVINGT